MDYYAELTELIYEKYDGNGDGGLDGGEWREFA